MKQQLLVAVCICIALFTHAQSNQDSTSTTSKNQKKNWAITVWSSYQLPIGQQAQYPDIWTTVGGYANKYDRGSFGQGWQAAIGISRKVNTRYSAELALGYLRSQSFTAKFSWNDNPFVVNGLGSVERQLQALRIFAGLSAPIYETTHFSLFIRGGAVFAIPKMQEEFVFYNMNNVIDGYQTNSTYSRIAPGFYAALGATKNVGKNWLISLDVLGIGQNWAPGKRTVTRFELYGENKLLQLDTWSKEIVYTEDVPMQQNNVNEPFKVFQVDYTLSSIGLKIGIVRSF